MEEVVALMLSQSEEAASSCRVACFDQWELGIKRAGDPSHASLVISDLKIVLTIIHLTT